MNGASKILTVSYGTFSCTLEGFDDPFNTMKAIAEYFRDLAAEDRYFGAEPPTPDAAMLHKIAEREIQRRVEAKIDGNGVILRAEEGVTPRVSFPSRPAPAPEPPPAPTLASMAEAAPAVESAAARLSRLRATQTLVAPAPYAAPYLPDPYAEFEAEPAAASSLAAQFAPDRVASPDRPASDKPVKAKDEKKARKAKKLKAEAKAKAAPVAVVQPESAPVGTAPGVTPPRTPLPADEPQPIAAEAHRAHATAADLPAPQSAHPSPALPEAAPHLDSLAAAIRDTLAGLMDADDQLTADMADADSADRAPAMETAAEASALDNSALADIEAQDHHADALPETSAAPEAEDTPLTMLADLPPAGPALAEPAPEDPAPQDPALAEIAPAAPDQPAAVPADADLTVLPPDALASYPDTPNAPLSHLASEAAQDQAEPEVALQPGSSTQIVAEKIQRARARVIKIRRLDADPQPAPEAQSEAAPVPSPVLTPEAEADLQHELAALEAELGSPAPTELRPAEPHHLTSAETDEASVNRLMAKTNTELEVPETKRRRSAIAHLKAAVLATVAERRANPNAGAPDSQRMDPYRQDLNQVMRPSDRPAPLVLVSSQRIDRKPAPTAIQPVRPRRVMPARPPALSSETDDDAPADGVENIFTDPTRQSFSEFAEGLGAHTMHDLIEAAGAYCTLILGRESFTRPQLFQQISTVTDQAEISREEGLRGFGRLLRDGRLTKTARGEYAMADSSPILNEARRRAG
jgi:hypothetical protein